MKTLKTLFAILSICFYTTANAQIWKNLSKKAGEAVEKTLEKKVEEKAEQETNKAFDSTFNNSKKNKKKISKKEKTHNTSIAEPASTFNFSHKYIMQLNDGKKPFEMIYYLTKAGNYLAVEMVDSKNKTITVMDLKEELMHVFMNNNGDKTRMSINMNLSQATEDAIQETEYTITATGNSKTILGYLCKEYKVKGKDMHGKVWITESAGITFSKTFYRTKQKKGMDQTWMSLVNGLPMEMTITDTSKRKAKTTTMNCILLKEENFSIKPSNYKKLM